MKILINNEKKYCCSVRSIQSDIIFTIINPTQKCKKIIRLIIPDILGTHLATQHKNIIPEDIRVLLYKKEP